MGTFSRVKNTVDELEARKASKERYENEQRKRNIAYPLANNAFFLYRALKQEIVYDPELFQNISIKDPKMVLSKSFFNGLNNFDDIDNILKSVACRLLLFRDNYDKKDVEYDKIAIKVCEEILFSSGLEEEIRNILLDYLNGTKYTHTYSEEEYQSAQKYFDFLVSASEFEARGAVVLIWRFYTLKQPFKNNQWQKKTPREIRLFFLCYFYPKYLFDVLKACLTEKQYKAFKEHLSKFVIDGVDVEELITKK